MEIIQTHYFAVDQEKHFTLSYVYNVTLNVTFSMLRFPKKTTH